MGQNGLAGKRRPAGIRRIQMLMKASGKRVLVIGAGMAGLAAARLLAESGRPVLMLEAQNRMGGRIRTLRQQGETLELGAEFVHGRPPELWKLIREAGLDTYALDGEMICHRRGKLGTCDEHGDVFKFLNGLQKWKGADLAFADYPPLARLPREQRHEVIQYVQSFNAADYRRIGVHALAVQQHAEQETGGGQIFRIRNGYDRVPEFLAQKVREAGGRIELSRPVQRIEWERGRVQVFALDGDDPVYYSAAQAVVALPLGVLQQPGVQFQPSPDALLAAHQLAMGLARRFTLLFRDRWWAADDRICLRKLSFLFAEDRMPPVWWSAHPAETRTLTGWIGGPRSAAFDQCTREQIGDAACQELALIFSRPVAFVRGQLISCATHDWHTDPYTRGAYSYVPAGALDAVLRMATPVYDTLYFAGEHTDTTGHWGTVHAAMRSGIRAAKQVLASEWAQAPALRLSSRRA